MLITLCCLAGAMSGSSVWLGWLDPSVPQAVALPSFPELLTQTRPLVAEGVALENADWRGVEIIGGGDVDAFQPFLAARVDRRKYHFFVDPAGRSVRSAQWSDQRPVPPGPQTVKIAVAQHHKFPEMSRAQWGAVQALVAALREAIGESGDGLPVRVAPEWARVYGWDPEVPIPIQPNFGAKPR